MLQGRSHASSSEIAILRQLNVLAEGMFRRWFASQHFVSDVTFSWVGLREYSSLQMEVYRNDDGN